MLLTVGQLTAFPLVGLLFFTSQSFSAAVNGSEHIVVFGDSLSDTGNVFRVTQGKVPDPNIYWQGRFSNGPIWIDQLASRLKAQVSDYAYGGATTNNTLVQSPVPSVLEQIDQAYPPNRTADSQHGEHSTYVIFAGANDYLRTVPNQGTENDTVIHGSVSSLLAAVEELRSRVNAQKFFIINLPPLELTPSALNRTASVRQAFTKASQKHNELLAKSLTEYQRKHSPLRIVPFDIHAYLSEVIHQPKKYGLENSHDSCVNLSPEKRAQCAYVFWDDVHLTTRANGLLAKEILTKWRRY